MKIKSGLSFALVLLGAGGCEKQIGGPENYQTDVSTELAFNDPTCQDIMKPLGVKVTNGSGANIVYSSWSFSVFRKGYSNDITYFSESLNSPSENGRFSDKIIEPGQTFTFCSSEPSLNESFPREELDYVVDMKNQFSG